jgi:S-adenosylmethionine:diacylglycerol 3-amino-3-carboxypropyl transferase
MGLGEPVTEPVNTPVTGPPAAVTLTVTPWEHGRFDARSGPSKVLFGRMYEDPEIELAAFRPASRVLSIASAGCTAMRLAGAGHRVVAIDINRDQLAYAAARLAGRPAVRGTAERVMDLARTFAPLVGWSRPRIAAFLELDDPAAQAEVWRTQLDTRRLRAAFAALFSVTALRAVYASPFLAFLPRRLGAVLRARMARCFARHANRTNPYAHALLAGALPDPPAANPAASAAIELVHSDAASYLEAAPAGSFDGVTLSNILDGASPRYRARLFAAVRRAAAPGAITVLRSFAEPTEPSPTNRADDDRAMLWGIVDVRPADALD